MAEQGRWRVLLGADGEASASLYSLNSLTIGSRALEYRPLLTISCSGAEWAQSLRLRDLMGGGPIVVTVQLDGRGGTESWETATRRGTLVRSGTDGVARLLEASRLRLAWSNGFFSGSGEAVFNLSGIDQAVAHMAEACGTAVP
jgi:hypothetical protein